MRATQVKFISPEAGEGEMKTWLSVPEHCERCGEPDISPNVEAFELSGECVCDECADQIFEDHSQFGVGA